MAAPKKIDYLRCKFQVGDKVCFNREGKAENTSELADAQVLQLVAKVKGDYMYQVSYTTDKGTPHERIHSQPWMERNLFAVKE